MATVEEYIQTVQQIKADIYKFFEEKMAAGTKPLHEEVERMKVALTKAVKDVEDWRKSQVTKMDDYGRIMVMEGRFTGMTALDLAIFKNIMIGRTGSRFVRRDTFEQIKQAELALRSGVNIESIFKWQERSLRQASLLGAGIETPSNRLMKEALDGWRQAILAEHTKALDSTTAAAGDELVPTLEAAELWMDVNLMTNVLPTIPQSPMPSTPFDIPKQFGDTNWYPVDENVQVTTTTPATGKTTLTAYTLKTGVPFSDELEEDSIVALVPELRSNLARNAAEVLDDVILNGDTTTANNINDDGVTIAKSTAGKAHWLLGFDGLVHLPFVDNTSQRKRISGALATTNYNDLLLKLGKYAAPQRRGDVVYVAPINVVLKTLTLAQVETIEKYGPRATISSGEITSLYGTPLIMSAQLKLSDTTGAIRDVTTSNTAGRILAFNATQWRVGFRRQITFEPDREPGKSQTVLYVSVRIALTERTGTRSSATHTALVYDITL